MDQDEIIQRLLESHIRQEANISIIAKNSDRLAVVTELIREDNAGMKESIRCINDDVHIGCWTKNNEREKKYVYTIAILAIVLAILFGIAAGIKWIPTLIDILKGAR